MRILALAVLFISALTATAQSNWRWANPLPGAIGWNGAAFGNGTYVMVGAGSAIATSPDGVTWTLRRPSGSLATLNGVAFADGRFIAVGMGTATAPGAAVILSSTDGINWTTNETVATRFNAQLYDVIHGGGTWVATGSSSVGLLSSPDGVTWTARAVPSGVIASRGTYGAGRFVISGNNNSVITSTDGITWTRQTVSASTSTFLNHVAFAGGKFVAVGRDGNFNNATFTSADATNWTPSNALPNSSGGAGLASIATNGSVFVTGGGAAPFYSSTDGVTWTQRSSNFPTSARQLGNVPDNMSAVAFANNQFLALGTSGSIATSPDGATWTRRSTGTINDLGTVLHDGTRFVVSGSGGTILTSPDGTAWTQLTTGSTADFNFLAYSGTRYVTAGFNGIYHSTNLTAWTPVAGTLNDRWGAVAYGGGRFVVANSATTLGVRTSTDGATWSANIGIPGAGGSTNGLVYGANLFVLTMSGFGGAPSKIYTSPDGTGWTQRAADIQASNTQVFSIAFGAGRFVALTGDQRVFTSTDGIAWTSTRLVTIPSLSGIRFVSGRFYASANTSGSPSYASTDGLTWTLVADSASGPGFSNSSNAGGAFAVSGTTVVAVSTGGTILRGELPVVSAAGRLINLSVLTDLATATDEFTLGYVVGGAGTSGAKPLVIRAAGPSLGALGVPGTLTDPKLETFAGAAKTGENDNWGGGSDVTAAMAAVGAFPYGAPTSRDAAVAASISTRDNSVRVTGVAGATGAVIAEVYDATPAASFTAATPRLLNVSVRKHLGTSLTAGFVVGGATSARVLIRVVGPGLAAFGVPDTVVDPQLVLFNAQSVQIDTNNDWANAAAITTAGNSVGAFPLPANSRDAALVATLPPGNYSVRASGVNNTSGVALVEVYELP